MNDLIALMLVLLAVAFLPWWRATDGGTNLLDHAPLALTEQLKELVGPDDRVFDPQLWGSWFELDVPDTPVFVDPGSRSSRRGVARLRRGVGRE